MLIPQSVVQQIASSPVLTPVMAAAAPFLRGGGGVAIDMARTKLRLEGLHQYGVVAALLMNAALRLFSATPKQPSASDTKVDAWAKRIFTVCVAMCVCLGSYTSIVFALLGLYSKRALGMGNDADFVEFFTATQGVRDTSFDSFFLMLLCFKGSFLLSIFLNFKDSKSFRWFIAGLVLAADLYGWWNWSAIVRLASKLLLIRDI